MNKQDIKKQLPVCDSETSLDYYVTTVKQTPPLHLKDRMASVFVSVDEAGTVKLRKRKKSKRRKKKNSFVLEESRLRASDDGVIYQSSGSDGSFRKVPRRSSSLCDRYLKKNTRSDSFNKILSEYRRRGGHKSQATMYSKRAIEDRENIDPAAVRIKTRLKRNDNISTNIDSSQHNGKELQSSFNSQGVLSQLSIVEENGQPRNNASMQSSAVNKKINRHDALATLSAFMLEVEEATTVAKQQEGDRKRESDSRSLNSLTDEKTESKIASVPSNNVIVNGRYEGSNNSSVEHLAPTVENGFQSESEFRSVSSAVSESAATDDPSSEKDLYQIMLKETSYNISQLPIRSSPSKQSSMDYGLAHLEQICKLFEQIGCLRRRNQALTARVHQLEFELDSVKKDRGDFHPTDTSASDIGIPPNHLKQNHRVARLRDAMRSSRKSNTESKRYSSYMPSTYDGISSSGFSPNSKGRPISKSNGNLHSLNDHHIYSHDDIELTKSGKWRFWKGSSSSINKNPLRKRSPSLKYDIMQKPYVYNRKDFAPASSILANNQHEDRTRLTPPLQTHRSFLRMSSKGSDIGVDGLQRSNSSYAGRAPYSEERLRAQLQRSQGDNSSSPGSHKDSFRQKLSKLEKAAARKLSLESFRRTHSVDRVDPGKCHEGDASLVKQKCMSNDLYKSMPCVIQVASPEWDGLQTAFPTKQKNGKVSHRLPNAIRARLTSPLRKKGNKRKSLSFAKRKSGYYLPEAGDMASNPHMDEAGSMCDQLTIELNQDDVKGITCSDDDELDYDKGRTTEVRRKLSTIDDSNDSESFHEQEQQHSSSSLTGYRTTGGIVRSSQTSRRSHIARPSSCDLLDTYY